MLGWSVQKSNKITFCHFANCAHHKTLHLHIHTHATNDFIKSNYLTTQLILCACQYMQYYRFNTVHKVPCNLLHIYQTPVLSSSNIANSHSNMPHTRTQHCPCTISKIIKESLPIGVNMSNDMITLTHANCTATCTTHPALLLAPQLPMHGQNNCKL